eukprot:6791820-Alexandrium_andersonii.AAC.1
MGELRCGGGGLAGRWGPVGWPRGQRVRALQGRWGARQTLTTFRRSGAIGHRWTVPESKFAL